MHLNSKTEFFNKCGLANKCFSNSGHRGLKKRDLMFKKLETTALNYLQVPFQYCAYPAKHHSLCSTINTGKGDGAQAFWNKLSLPFFYKIECRYVLAN